MPRAVLRVAIDCDDVGRRVTVRRRLATGGFSDVVGILEDCTPESFAVRDRRGTLHRMARSEIVAAKVVPAPRAR